MNEKPVPPFNYEILTPFYDFLSALLGYGDTQRNNVIDLLNLKENENLLDVGCGTGSLALMAKKRMRSLKIVGIDVDQKALGLAEQKFVKEKLDGEFIKTSADELPFEDAHFDAVVSTLAFHHLPTAVKAGALKEISRVLKPHGRFLLVDFGKAEGIFKFLFFLEKLFRIPEAKTAKDNMEGRIPHYLERAGFTIKEVAPRYRGIQFLLARKSD